MPGYQHKDEGAAMPDEMAAPQPKDSVDRRLETLLSAIYGAPETPAPPPAKPRPEPAAIAEAAPEPEPPKEAALPKEVPPRPPGRTFGVSLMLGAAIVAVTVMLPFLPRISVGPNDVRVDWPSREPTAAMASSAEPRPTPPALETVPSSPPPPIVAAVTPEAAPPPTPPVVAAADPVVGNDPARQPVAAMPPELPSKPVETVAMTAPQATAPAPPAAIAPARDPDPAPSVPDLASLSPVPAAVPAIPPAPAEAAIPADPPTPPAPSHPRKADRVAAAAEPSQFLVQFGAFRSEAIGQKDCADYGKLAATQLVRSSKGEDTWYLCRTDAPRSRDEAKAVVALAATSGKVAILVPFHQAQ